MLVTLLILNHWLDFDETSFINVKQKSENCWVLGSFWEGQKKDLSKFGEKKLTQIDLFVQEHKILMPLLLLLGTHPNVPNYLDQVNNYYSRF